MNLILALLAALFCVLFFVWEFATTPIREDFDPPPRPSIPVQNGLVFDDTRRPLAGLLDSRVRSRIDHDSTAAKVTSRLSAAKRMNDPIPSRMVSKSLLCLLIILGSSAMSQSRPAPKADVLNTGSTLTAKEADTLVRYHNKARQEVNVEKVKWSPTLAQFAQKWADEVARTGKLAHRPYEGEWRQEYGENMAWGFGGSYGVLAAAERWYEEKKSYTPGTPIPDDLSGFKAAHYTQMVWKDTREIGAGRAIIRQGERKGWTIIVCNYHPAGNIGGQKPY